MTRLQSVSLGDLVLPDPMIDPSFLSAAVLLYFEGPFVFAAPPAVMTGEAFALMEIVRSRRPSWSGDLERIVGSLVAVNKAAAETLKRFQQAMPATVQSVYYAYPANREAYERVDAWVHSSGSSYDQLQAVAIAPLGAAELARHIFLERFLELERDHDALYQYCDYVLGAGDTNSLVVASYLLRLQVMLSLPAHQRMLLTNEALAQFLEVVVQTASRKAAASEAVPRPGPPPLDLDIIGWEFFRVLVSRVADPLTFDNLERIRRIRAEESDYVARLKARCRELATYLAKETSVVGLGEKALREIDRTMRKELREIFELDERAWRDFTDSLASDKAVWASIGGLLGGLAGLGPVATSAGIVGALISVGTAATKARSARQARLRDNDLALLRVLQAAHAGRSASRR